jgi:hypothetical protein
VRHRVAVNFVVHFRRSQFIVESSRDQHAIGPPRSSIVQLEGLHDVATRHHTDIARGLPSGLSQMTQLLTFMLPMLTLEKRARLGGCTHSSLINQL